MILEDTRQVRHRGRLGAFWRDLVYAIRILRHTPAFAAAAVLSLALGIGATTVVFSIADTVYLRPLPYKDPGRLAWVAVQFPSIGREMVTAPDFVSWRRDNRVFESLAAATPKGSIPALLGGSDPVEANVARISANFLDTFGVAPEAGRGFRPEEELPNGPKAVLLTHQFWRAHFHGQRNVIGSIVTLDAQPYNVAGILPETFAYPMDVKVDVVIPLTVPPDAGRRDTRIMMFAVYGRLKPGVTMAQAQTDLNRLFAAARAESPQMWRDEERLIVQPLREHRAGNVRALLFILMGAAGCLLAIACANVANLLLARWSARAREFAVRAAIGAGRGRLARQLFTEISLLIAAGTAVAMIFASVALRAFVYYAAGELPRLNEVTADLRVFAIALVVSAATAVVFGGFPALRSGRVDLHSVLQQAGRACAGSVHGMTRRVLVSLEVALSVILLTGSALLIETLWHMRNDRLGFQPEHVLTVSIPLRGPGFTGPARAAIAEDVLTMLGRIPGTEAVSLTECTPVSTGRSALFSRTDRPLPDPVHSDDTIGYCKVGPEYFKAAGSRVVQGRVFTPDDFQHPNALAVINESAARAYFPGENPVGRQILGGRGNPWREVVGVVADTKNQGLNQPAVPQAYLNDTSASFSQDLFLIVRSMADGNALARALRDGLRAQRPGLFAKTQTLDQAIGEMTASPRFNTVLLSGFAGLAFLMAIIGVYGVLAFSVAQRRGEIGIRMALGATPRAVVGLLLREGALLIAAGIVAGVVGASYLTKYLGTLLYGVRPTDPMTFAVVGMGLIMSGLLASFLPACRAAVIDPLVSLRHE